MMFLAGNILAAGAGSDLWTSIGPVIAFILFPVLLIACSSFIKISIVLSFLRSALGVQVPSNIIITVLAAILSIFIMSPVVMDILYLFEPYASNVSSQDPFGILKLSDLFELISNPLENFLKLNTSDEEIAFFTGLSNAPVTETSLIILVPAFVLTEITEAFVIGFLIYIPFVLVDIIVANTLMAAGMTAMSPAIISMPVKLLLFIVVDGWHMITEGLILNYVT